MKVIIVIPLLVLLAFPAAAQESPPSIEDMKSASDVCAAHAIPDTLSAVWGADGHFHPGKSKFMAGWEHCDRLVALYREKQRAVDAVDESKNPDLKSSRDIARKLGIIK